MAEIFSSYSDVVISTTFDDVEDSAYSNVVAAVTHLPSTYVDSSYSSTVHVVTPTEIQYVDSAYTNIVFVEFASAENISVIDTDAVRFFDSVTLTDLTEPEVLKNISVIDIDKVNGYDFYVRPRETTYASIDDVITGKFGTVQYQIGMRLYNAQRVFTRDISDWVYDLSLDWDETRTIKRTLTFSYIPQNTHDELQRTDYVEPFVTVVLPETSGGNTTTTQELSFGYYTSLAHRIQIDLSSTNITYTGYDLLTNLVDATVNTVYTVPRNAGYDTIIRQLCGVCGFADVDIVLPVPTQTVPTTLTWEVGTTYYAIVEKLGDALNWDGPFIGYNNKLYFVEMQDLTTAPSNVTYATDQFSMILPTISLNHDVTSVINNIVVSVDDPLRTPFSETYMNNNTSNPYSYTNTGILRTKLYEDLDHIASTTKAQDRAKFLMQRDTPPHTMNLTTWLDFRRSAYELYTIYINELSHSSLRWRCTAWTMNLSIGGTMSHTLREVLEI